MGLSRPADVLLKNWDRGSDTAVDFTIVSPLGLAAFPLHPERTKRHLNDAEKEKRAKNEPNCNAVGWQFQPAAYSPWGGQGSGAKQLMYEVLKRATADLDGWPKIQKSQHIRANLRIALARQVARQLALRCRVQDAIAPEY